MPARGMRKLTFQKLFSLSLLFLYFIIILTTEVTLRTAPAAAAAVRARNKGRKVCRLIPRRNDDLASHPGACAYASKVDNTLNLFFFVTQHLLLLLAQWLQPARADEIVIGTWYISSAREVSLNRDDFDCSPVVTQRPFFTVMSFYCEVCQFIYLQKCVHNIWTEIKLIYF